jgi:Tol biopolymer transport system component
MKRSVLLVLVLVLSVGVVVGGSVSPVGAAGGSLTGPIGGGGYFSVGAKVGANGDVVAYSTALRNFVPTFPSLLRTVYLRDRTKSGAAANVAVVRPLGGAQPDGDSLALGVSPDPTTSYVLYRSAASNLVAGDTLGHEDVFLFNRVTAATERVSVGTGGVQGNGPATAGAMSGNTTNGNPRYVVFVSAASNLVAGDTNGATDVFLRDRTLGTTVLVSKSVAGTAANGDSFQPVVSDDGRFVAFTSGASNVVAGDSNGSLDVFVRDMVAGTTERVSVGFDGEGIGASTWPQISADGRFVAFDSAVDELVPDDDNISYDVFVRDRVNGSTERVSVGPNGEQGDWNSESPSMSRDGRYIAFDTDAEEFDPDDGNISIDVYVRDRLARTTERASEKGNGFEAFGDSSGASISPEGRFVGFDTDSGEFFENTDLNDDYDIYLKDMAAPFFNNPTVGSRFKGITPKRLLDTRTSGGKLNGPGTRDLVVTGSGTGVPSGATAVVLNVTSTEASSAAGYVTVGPKGGLDTNTSSLNLQPGATVPNLVTAKVGSGGQISLYTNLGSVHLIVDVFGYYAPDDGDAFTGVQPSRVLDTRGDNVPAPWPSGQPFVGGNAVFGQMDLPVAGVADVPPEARAVVLNVTSTEATTANGYVTVAPAGGLNTGTSNLNLQPGFNVPNLVIVKVGTGGKVTLYTNVGSVDLIVDVVGYYGPFGGDLFFPLNPGRILDTRSSASNTLLPKLSPLGGGASSTADLPVAGKSGVPLNARAAIMNVTSTQATSNGGYTTVWPSGFERPLASSLNYRVGVNVPNAVQVKLGNEGRVSVFNGAGTVHLIADVNGYFR